MQVETFIYNLGLADVADVMHKHPLSGSDYSIKSLLEGYHRYISGQIQEDILQAITDPENQPNQFGIQLN